MIAILFIFALVTSVLATDKCVLDIQLSSVSCEAASWDGFLENKCCESSFEEYLSALAKHANQTGTIFINSRQQQSCRSSLEGSNGRNLLSCGVGKLASGTGSCSDFSLTDVADKLESSLTGLAQDCESLDSRNGCRACYERWKNIGALSVNSSVQENDICRFSVLVSMVSRKIYDTKWVQAVYQCLGQNQSHQSQNLENDHHHHKKRMSIGDLTISCLCIKSEL